CINLEKRVFPACSAAVGDFDRHGRAARSRSGLVTACFDLDKNVIASLVNELTGVWNVGTKRLVLHQAETPTPHKLIELGGIPEFRISVLKNSLVQQVTH